MKFLITLLVFLSLFSHHSLGLVVIQYHHVDENTPHATSISPSLFDQHIKYLAENDFEVISGERFAQYLHKENKKEITKNKKQILITFDDGYQSILSQAHQTLTQYDFPYVVFINPTRVGSKGYLSLGELKHLENDGVTIANHTLTHPHMIRKKPLETQQQWLSRMENEVLKTQEFIEKNFQSNVKLVAFPYGEYNQPLKNFLRANHFIGFSQHSGPIGEKTDVQALPRFTFGGNYGSLEDFQIKVNSLPLPISRIKIEDEQNRVMTDPLLPSKSSKPKITLYLKASTHYSNNLQLTCFASGIGVINVNKLNSSTFTAQTPQSLPIGRSRYNCTATSSIDGRYYWFSIPFYRKNNDGSWYSEY